MTSKKHLSRQYEKEYKQYSHYIEENDSDILYESIFEEISKIDCGTTWLELTPDRSIIFNIVRPNDCKIYVEYYFENGITSFSQFIGNDMKRTLNP